MKKTIPALLSLAVLVAACVLPNKYQATATVEKDACQVEYKGQFQVLAAMDKRVPPEQAKKLTIDTMKRLESEIMQQNGTIKTNILGQGVFEATISMKEPITKQPKPILNLFSVQDDGQGKVTIKTLEANEREKKDFPEQGIENKGELTIKTKGKILEENAMEKPTWLTKWFTEGYSWKLDLMKSPPASMVIQF